REAGDEQSTRREVRGIQGDRSRVAVWAARDLTEDPVPAPHIGETDGRPDLRLRQVRKREGNQDYFPGCRCDHAASSSGRFQSTARAASASSAASPGTTAGSSSTVTSARRGPGTWTSPSS